MSGARPHCCGFEPCLGSGLTAVGLNHIWSKTSLLWVSNHDWGQTSLLWFWTMSGVRPHCCGFEPWLGSDSFKLHSTNVCSVICMNCDLYELWFIDCTWNNAQRGFWGLPMLPQSFENTKVTIFRHKQLLVGLGNKFYVLQRKVIEL